MHILVTNDDGILAPGLMALAKAMRNFGEVSIMAPDRNWSGGGHVKTLDRPLRIKEVTLADGSLAYASDGAPSDCVALALLGFFPEKIDLVVSGINPMPNLGHDVTYSGTVTAAMESVIWGIPAIAFSVNSNESHLDAVDYSASIDVIQQIIEKILQHRIPAGILLNVNLPYLPKGEIKGIRITRQGLRVYNDRLDRRVDPRGREYFWIGGDKPTGLPENGTDIGALDGGYVSITPLQLDLTAYPALHMINQWNWEQPGSSAIAMEPYYKVIATPAKIK
jgi:5'-nucleotidase